MPPFSFDPDSMAQIQAAAAVLTDRPLSHAQKQAELRAAMEAASQQSTVSAQITATEAVLEDVQAVQDASVPVDVQYRRMEGQVLHQLGQYYAKRGDDAERSNQQQAYDKLAAGYYYEQSAAVYEQAAQAYATMAHYKADERADFQTEDQHAVETLQQDAAASTKQAAIMVAQERGVLAAAVPGGDLASMREEIIQAGAAPDQHISQAVGARIDSHILEQAIGTRFRTSEAYYLFDYVNYVEDPEYRDNPQAHPANNERREAFRRTLETFDDPRAAARQLMARKDWVLGTFARHVEDASGRQAEEREQIFAAFDQSYAEYAAYVGEHGVPAPNTQIDEACYKINTDDPAAMAYMKQRLQQQMWGRPLSEARSVAEEHKEDYHRADRMERELLTEFPQYRAREQAEVEAMLQEIEQARAVEKDTPARGDDQGRRMIELSDEGDTLAGNPHTPAIAGQPGNSPVR